MRKLSDITVNNEELRLIIANMLSDVSYVGKKYYDLENEIVDFVLLEIEKYSVEEIDKFITNTTEELYQRLKRFKTINHDKIYQNLLNLILFKN